jgi:hypothetical protein
MELYVLQVSLLPIENALFYQEGKEKDIRHFEDCLDFYSKQDEPDPWVLRLLISDPEQGIKAGFISRPLPANLYDYQFKLHKEKSFPPILWIWDRYEQALLVQRNSRIFADAEAAARIFASIANPCLRAQSLLVHIHPKIDEAAFWHVYDSMHTVESIEMELTVPNIFGETKQKVRDFLSEVAHDTNATSFKPTFENIEGKLVLKKTSWLDSLLDWIKDGGGSWAIKGRMPQRKRKTRKTSSKSARILHYPVGATLIDMENYSAKEIKIIIESLRPQYSFRKDYENRD